jgi:hypothetical protein
MGKRGPQPKGEYGHKTGRTAVLSTRLQPDTRARLVAAAKSSGRSLSQELEHRLRRTFIDDDNSFDWYGSEQTAAVVKLIGAAIQSVAVRRSSKGKEYNWLTHEFLFDDVTSAIQHILLWFRPGGDSGRRSVTLSSGTDEAERLINEIRSADPSIPITKRSRRQHVMAMLKDKLGDLAKGSHPHDKWRGKVPKVTIMPALEIAQREAARRKKK